VPFSALTKRATNTDFPLDALEAILVLRRELDSLEGEMVRTARELGATWEMIARALGVSRQAAYLRHGKDEGKRKADPPGQER
jgi:DNA invertase Pin-like site-specific DNA recombinase